MSTTSGLELFERADLLTRELRRTVDVTTVAQWETFDTTVHRLLLELVGIGYRYVRFDDPVGRALREAIESYPVPLRPPAGEQLTIAGASRYLDTSAAAVARKVRRGQLHSVQVDGIDLIDTQELDQRPDIRPADPTDGHPVAKLSSTLGAMADMVRHARDAGIDVMAKDGEVAGAILRVLSFTAVTARYAIQTGDLVDAVRPVLVGSYAERVMDTLRGVALHPVSLGQLTSVSVAAEPKTPNDRLEAAIYNWSVAAKREVGRPIPSASALRQIADRGAHMSEVRAQLEVDVDGEMATQFRRSTEALAAAAKAWGSLTTLTRPDHEFVTASHELNATLKSLEGQLVARSPSVNRAMAVAQLDRGIEAVDGFMSLTRSHPDRLLAAGILRGPARGMNPTAERLRDRQRGNYVPATLADVPELQAKWRAAGESLSHTRTVLVSPTPAMHL